jgi:hypothetical protein
LMWPYHCSLFFSMMCVCVCVYISVIYRKHSYMFRCTHHLQGILKMCCAKVTKFLKL